MKITAWFDSFTINRLPTSLLMGCLVFLTPTTVWASHSSSLTPAEAPASEWSTDEVDELTQSAKAASAVINQNLKAHNEQIASLIIKIKLQINEIMHKDSALAEIINQKSLISKLELVALNLKQVRDVEDPARDAKEMYEEAKELFKLALRVIAEHYERVNQTTSKISQTEDVSKLKETITAAEKKVWSAEGVLKPLPIITRIARDRIEATKFIEFVRSNNRTSLSEMLKRDLPGINVDVREVKDTDGLMAVFRIDGVTHCLSTKTQCGGKPYSTN